MYKYVCVYLIAYVYIYIYIYIHRHMYIYYRAHSGPRHRQRDGRPASCLPRARPMADGPATDLALYIYIYIYMYIVCIYIYIYIYICCAPLRVSLSYSPYSTPLRNRFGAALGCFFYRLGREETTSQSWLKRVEYGKSACLTGNPN